MAMIRTDPTPEAVLAAKVAVVMMDLNFMSIPLSTSVIVSMPSHWSYIRFFASDRKPL